MAKKQITIVVDDLTGEEAQDARTIPFAVDGVSYEIDLTSKNAEKLMSAFEPYISAGRKVGGRARSTRSGGRSDAARIREWAISQGLDVPSRGRIPRSIAEQYATAH